MAARSRGIVHRRKGSPHWHYDWTIHGRRLRGSTKTSDKERATAIALKVRQQLLDELNGLTEEVPVEMTLRAACTRYWEEYAQHLNSWETVWAHLGHLERIFGGTTVLSAINEQTVRAFVSKRRTEAAPATVNRNLSTLRRMNGMAEEDWHVKVSKVRFSRFLLPEPCGREVFLSDEQAQRLVDAIVPHAKAILELALFTGLRRGNIRDLRWEQIDLDAGRITVRVKHRHSGGKTHSVPLIHEAVNTLVRLAPIEAERFGPVFYYGNVHVACPCPTCRHRQDLRGEPIKDIKRAFDTARKKIGLRDVRFHDLRHTVASRLIQRGCPLKIVKEILGHCDIRMTERYSHLETGMLQDAMEHALSLNSRRLEAKGAELPQRRALQFGNSLKPAPLLAEAGGIEPPTFGFGDQISASEHQQNPRMLELLEELTKCILDGNDSN